MIKAYFDESGVHQESPLLCVAGYVGSEEEWRAFTEEWIPLLNRFGISCFHAKDPKSDKLRPYLVEAIANRKLRGIICSVDPETYKLYASTHMKSKVGNAYAACAFMCGIEIGKWVKENNLNDACLIYEAGQPNANYIYKTFEAMIVEAPDFGISGIAVAKKEKYIPLQTADFLSHVCSVNDVYWINQLNNIGNIFEAKMSKEQLENSSREIWKLLSKQRQLRRNALNKFKKIGV